MESNNLLTLQFGGDYQRAAAGYRLTGRVYASSHYLWITPVDEGAHLEVAEPLYEGYVSNNAASEFLIGVTPGEYQVTITSYDPKEDHGPFDILCNTIPVVQNCQIKAEKIEQWTFSCQPENGSLKLKFFPQPGADFLLNSLTLSGPEGAATHSVFASAPPTELPSRAALDDTPSTPPSVKLQEICNWLLAQNQRQDAFIGDRWESNMDYWYTISFPIRTLMAGYEILGDSRYLDRAFQALDLFAGEQMPNGSWIESARFIPTAELSQAEIDTITRERRAPMSDIGSVVTTLAIGSVYASGERKQWYRDAVKRYCDLWAIRFQQPSGGFSDGYTGKEHQTNIYSCATAIEAAVYSLAYHITGEPGYLDVANKAIRFLLPDWLVEDGRMIGRAPHWVVRNRMPFVMETQLFGDQYYYDEGFITTAIHTRDEDLRRQIHTALGWRVNGRSGLLNSLGKRAWWQIENKDIWIKAKSVGIVQTLLYARRCGFHSPELEEAIHYTSKIICTDQYASRLGIMVKDEERPALLHGLRTWSGMVMEVTGFAGMTLAEIVKPEVLYVPKTK